MKYSASRILKNIFSLSLSHAIVQVLSVIIGIIVARYLGKTQFGQYSTIIVYVGLFSVFCDFGASYYLLRESAISKEGIRNKFGTVLILSLIVCSVVYFAMVVILAFTNYSPIVIQLITFYGIVMFFLQLQKTFYAILQINQKQNLQAISEVILTGLRLAFYIAVIFLGFGLKGIVFSNMFGTIVGIILVGLLVFVKFERPTFNIQTLPSVFKRSYLFWLSGIFTFAYFQSDTLMLSFMRSPDEVGLYSSAYKLVILGNELPIIIMNYVLLPLMFNFGLNNNNKDELLKFYTYSSKYLLMLGLPLSVSLFILSKQIITFLYGVEFILAAAALEILAFALVLRFMSSCAGAVLTSLDRMGLKVGIQASLAAGNILLNLYFIKKYGFIGAAITTLISELALMTLYLVFVGKYFGRVSVLRDLKIFQVAISSFLMGAFLYLTREFIFLPGLIAGGIIIYLLSLNRSGFLSPSDRQFIYEVISKKLGGQRTA